MACKFLRYIFQLQCWGPGVVLGIFKEVLTLVGIPGKTGNECPCGTESTFWIVGYEVVLLYRGTERRRRTHRYLAMCAVYDVKYIQLRGSWRVVLLPPSPLNAQEAIHKNRDTFGEVPTLRNKVSIKSATSSTTTYPELGSEEVHGLGKAAILDCFINDGSCRHATAPCLPAPF